MKKCLALLLALVLVLGCSSAPAEEETAVKEKDLFEIWDFSGESMSWVCTAVPVADGAVMVSPALLPEKQDQLAVTDDSNVWEVKAVVPDPSGLMALLLYDTGEATPRYSAWELLPYGESIGVTACFVRSGDAMGSRINHRVLSSESFEWQDTPCLMLTLSDPVPPGSPVLTTDGNLAALIVSQYAEGVNRFIALPADGIAAKLTEISALLVNMPEWNEAPEGLRVTANKNRVTVDWTEMTLPEKKDGEELYLVVLDGANNYLNFYPAEEQRKMSLILTPGRFYIFGIGAYANPPSNIPEQNTTLMLPQAEKLTDHNFSPILTAIAETEGKEIRQGEVPVPVTEVTEELLRSGRAWFYSASSYEVEKTIINLSLLVTLTDPNGVNYRYESTWAYDQSCMKEDVWYMSLQDCGLTSGLDQNGYPKGTYEVAYYVGGELADSFTFDLK